MLGGIDNNPSPANNTSANGNLYFFNGFDRFVGEKQKQKKHQEKKDSRQ